MRALEGQGHLLWALGRGRPRPAREPRSTWSSRAAPPLCRPAWLRGPDKAALQRSSPARELARGLPDAGTRIPHPCLDLCTVTVAGTAFLTLPHLAPHSRPQPGLGPGGSGGRSGP